MHHPDWRPTEIIYDENAWRYTDLRDPLQYYAVDLCYHGLGSCRVRVYTAEQSLHLEDASKYLDRHGPPAPFWIP